MTEERFLMVDHLDNSEETPWELILTDDEESKSTTSESSVERNAEEDNLLSDSDIDEESKRKRIRRNEKTFALPKLTFKANRVEKQIDWLKRLLVVVGIFAAAVGTYLTSQGYLLQLPGLAVSGDPTVYTTVLMRTTVTETVELPAQTVQMPAETVILHSHLFDTQSLEKNWGTVKSACRKHVPVQAVAGYADVLRRRLNTKAPVIGVLFNNLTQNVVLVSDRMRNHYSELAPIWKHRFNNFFSNASSRVSEEVPVWKAGFNGYMKAVLADLESRKQYVVENTPIWKNKLADRKVLIADQFKRHEKQLLLKFQVWKNRSFVQSHKLSENLLSQYGKVESLVKRQQIGDKFKYAAKSIERGSQILGEKSANSGKAFWKFLTTKILPMISSQQKEYTEKFYEQKKAFVSAVFPKIEETMNYLVELKQKAPDSLKTLKDFNKISEILKADTKKVKKSTKKAALFAHWLWGNYGR